MTETKGRIFVEHLSIKITGCYFFRTLLSRQRKQISNGLLNQSEQSLPVFYNPIHSDSSDRKIPPLFIFELFSFEKKSEESGSG